MPASSASRASIRRKAARERSELMIAKHKDTATLTRDRAVTTPPCRQAPRMPSRTARRLLGMTSLVPATRRRTLAAASLLLLAWLAGCGSQGIVNAPRIAPARTFKLVNFLPTGPVAPGKVTTLSFAVQQPSGQPLTSFKRGAGPHTGVHLLIVRDDLASIVHRHPRIAADGSVRQSLVLPSPGPYRVIVDVYPKLRGSLPNFQLVGHLNVAGRYRPAPIPPFRSEQTVDGVRFTIAHFAPLRAITPALLSVTVRRADGSRPSFTPWYGALAHAIFFREGSLDYFHTHVCAPNATNCTSAFGAASVTGHSASPGKLTVGVLVPIPGTWRLFLQTRVDGHVLTAPFTLEVH
jgi:hypothetical protein